MIKKFIGKNVSEAMKKVKKDLGEDAIILSTKSVNGVFEVLASKEESLESIINQKLNEEESKNVNDVKNVESKNSQEDFCIEKFCLEITEENSEKNELLNTEKKEEKPKVIDEKIDLPKRKIKSIKNKIEANHEGLFSIAKKIEDSNPQKESKVEDFFDLFRENQSIENSQAKTLLDIKGLDNKTIISNNNTKNIEEKEQEKGKESNIVLELRTLKKIVDNYSRKNGINEFSDIKLTLMKKIINSGFSVNFAKTITENVSSDNLIDAETLLRKTINDKLPVIKLAQEMVKCGGTYALIGPTGVGKTTTVAKIASKATKNININEIGLLTTDNYRIAAYEQLKIFGKLLGINVGIVKNNNDIIKHIEKYKKEKKLTLIDTVGLSPNAVELEEMLMALNSDDEIKKILVIPANLNKSSIEKIIMSYSKYGIDGCILTKEDEVDSIATAVESIIEHELPLYYVTNGQRVPEDLSFPNKKMLINRAFINSKINISQLDLALLLSEI